MISSFQLNAINYTCNVQYTINFKISCLFYNKELTYLFKNTWQKTVYNYFLYDLKV